MVQQICRATWTPLVASHLLRVSNIMLRSGDFTGTPCYICPEQLAGAARGVDARTDVYSLGVTLYESSVLFRPFEGTGAVQVLRAIQAREPIALRLRKPLATRSRASWNRCSSKPAASPRCRARSEPGAGERRAQPTGERPIATADCRWP